MPNGIADWKAAKNIGDLNVGRASGCSNNDANLCKHKDCGFVK